MKSALWRKHLVLLKQYNETFKIGTKLFSSYKTHNKWNAWLLHT
jgi:hypothetical protein